MSLVSVFLTTVTRSLRLGSQPTALDPLNKHVEVRHSNVATLQDPRFTNEQLDKMAKAANAKHLLKS